MKPTLLLLALTSSLFAAERPEVTVPRQTSGGTLQSVVRLRERLAGASTFRERNVKPK